MVEKTVFDEQKKDRFAFVLSVNGYIICRRDFWINGFKERSVGSVQLVDAIDKCVEMINDDLKDKSSIYLHYTAPQVFKDEEELASWVENQQFKLDIPSFILVSNTDKTYIWGSNGLQPYEKPFNRSEYCAPVNTDDECIFKFAFLDSEKEVRSVSWDGRVYPKFVRSNIDISNSKNKYKAEGVYAPVEEFIVNEFMKSQTNLIPEIMKTISSACSLQKVSDYDYVLDYGKRKYAVNIEEYNERLFRSMNAERRRKAFYTE